MTESTKQNIQLRDARDRLNELLGLGEPYPLRDLPVPAGGLTVPFGQAAKIPIEYSQLGVLYQLHDHEKPVTRSPDGGEIPVEDEGRGETLRLVTPRIENDVTFQILATKVGSGREAYLHTSATVKVGLDKTLVASIINQPPLDPTADSILATDPRLADYEDTIEVEIEQSQAGVDYRLVHGVDDDRPESEEIELSVEDVRGTDGNITLYSRPVQEDMEVRIRATKTFDPSEGRATQTDLLNIKLPLKVKANRALNMAVSPAAIVDYGTETRVRIAATQQSAEYRVYAHKIRDPEFVHDPAPDSQVLRVQLPDEPEVQLRRPLLPEPWQPIADFVPVSDYQAGNGGELKIPIGQFRDDSLIAVETRKVHRVSDQQSLASSVWLAQPAAVLVRPNPMPGLKLSVVMQGAVTDGRLWVADGQPGVFYYFRTTESEKLPLPAYFYQRDDFDSRLNKGLGQLEVGIDLVVAADPPSGAVEPAVERESLAPELPRLVSGPLDAGATLSIRAVKAQSRIEASLIHTAQIVALPAIRLQQAGVVAGGVAKILVPASHTGDRYELMLDGKAMKPALSGNGTDLEFVSEPVTNDTEFEVWVTRPDADGIAVKRVVSLRVLIRPDAKLAVSAAASVVEHNGATDIQIESSQMGVSYQLFVGGSEVGSTASGNGARLRLTTGPLTADATFVVRASRLVDPTVSVELTQQVKITVRPEGA